MGEYGDQKSPKEMMLFLSQNLKTLRKQEKMSQMELSERSAVAYASVRKFETTGVISLESLLKLCETLKRLTEFESILRPNDMRRKKELFNQ